MEKNTVTYDTEKFKSFLKNNGNGVGDTNNEELIFHNNNEIFEDVIKQLMSLLIEKNISSSVLLNGGDNLLKSETLVGEDNYQGLAHLCLDELLKYSEKYCYKIYFSMFKCQDHTLKDLIQGKIILPQNINQDESKNVYFL
jgi:hypothetical protein